MGKGKCGLVWHLFMNTTLRCASMARGKDLTVLPAHPAFIS